MGLFDNIFNGSSDAEKKSKINWISLTESNKLETLISESKEKPVLIFKHSTRCGISRMALKSFEKSYDLEESDLEMYYLDLLAYRSLSNEISLKLNIHHQSPQVLVVKNGKTVYHDSHYQISIQKIKKVLELN